MADEEARKLKIDALLKDTHELVLLHKQLVTLMLKRMLRKEQEEKAKDEAKLKFKRMIQKAFEDQHLGSSGSKLN